MDKVKVGEYYKHYKGNYYQVLAIARHSETLEELVIYQGQYTHEEFGDKPVWARPVDLFIEMVEKEGKTFPRFEYIGPSLE